jgi:dienelactone hydrolase
MNKKIILSTFIVLFSLNIHAEIVTEEISYQQNGTVMKGLLAYDNSLKGERPGVLVVHEWWGHNDYARQRAKMLAESGYTALAVDMYGDGKTAEHPDDAGKFSSAVGGNLPLAQKRFESAMNTLKQHKSVQKDKLAAIGYCFGGGIVLHMARLGLDLDGVVSFHGSLVTSSPAKKGQVKARVRVFNGAADPFVTSEQINAFKAEMSAADVDFQLVNYPNAQHSFTNKEADLYAKKFNLPLAYNKEADEDSWKQMQKFFKEMFY